MTPRPSSSRRRAAFRFRRRPRGRRQRGIAMLAVITAVAICMVIVNDFGTSTTIDMLQARNNLDQMRAHFLARSSLDITELIVRLQDRLDGVGRDQNIPAEFKAGLEGVQITDFADPLMMAFGGDAEQVQGAIGLSVGQTKGLGANIGTFGVRITPIDGKINVNCANAPLAGTRNPAALVARMLESLVYPPAFDPVFEEADAEGWRRDRRTQVTAILDYIDRNNTRAELRDDKVETGNGPEAYGYEDLRDTYKPKNHYIDSISELKLVRGVDDRFWTLFGNAFRVYGGCRINLRGLDDPKVIAAIISLTAKDKNDPLLRDAAGLWQLANLVITAKQYGLYFAGEDGINEFATFVKDPTAFFAGMASGGDGQDGQAAPSAGVSGMPPIPPTLKIELDTGPEGLARVVTSDPIQTYQVEAWGEVTRDPLMPARRTLQAVWDQKHQNQDTRNPLTPKGAWLYLREE